MQPPIPSRGQPISGFLNNLTTFDTGAPVLTYTDNTVVSGPTYYYRVAASNTIGGGTAPGYPSMTVNSAWVTSTGVGSAPADPTGLSATALLGGTVRLSWTDNATNETGYEIQRADNGGTMATIATTPLYPGNGIATYTDITTVGPNSYVYQVRALGTTGNSNWSNQAPITLVAPPDGLPITDLTASLPTGPQVNLTWTNQSTNEAGFVIERSVNGGAFSVLATDLVTPAAGATVTYIDTTTVAINTYAYQLRAVNFGGYSAYSNVATILVGVPATPTNLAGVYDGTVPQIKLSWMDNANNEINYVVERADNGGAFATLVSNLAANPGTGPVGYNDPAILPDSSYIYRVKAVNGLGSSAYSNSVTVVTPPLAPSNVVATLVNGGIQITFTDNSVTETSFDHCGEYQRRSNLDSAAFTRAKSR